MNPRTRSPLRRRGQRGATVVEFALVAAIFCTMLIGICEFGRVLFYWNTASEAMRLGARTATVCDADATVIKQRITTLMPLLKASNVTLTYTPSGCDSDPTTARNTCTFVTLKVTGITVKTLIPFVKINVPMPSFTTTLPRESLMSSTGGTVCN
ncbi:TadE/TadG family type IV pilus assembly protein [Burkholderia stagnalis]|uniref:TadE/TadG family type IV pilus assembly protein n=1 Tax=Burkholderia stagnalis TaxID=1503054 RepID=UPI000757E19D|nr:TadE/TadG family type IV pilus assembly protein [Burkholderia stagnalis]KVM89857.1 pilus assembly protein TadG [Burkholderia stagnalis]KVX68062.1 pilus assembly protein TadG [Burkholderia stagnalis]KWE12405.1 pilus assembly protein TadG [Burkholderia stagnalis]KWE13134.1 pilus assembly protein TadG [Burkholderia stagnalis]KWH43086.1 pilus assembly protein TadG [Burkholderia stagnalis]